MADDIFGVAGGVGSFLTTLADSFNKQTATDTALAQKALEENKLIADSAATYNQQAQMKLEDFRTVQAQGEEARRLAESDNIFDRIELIGAQIIKPRAYTREGRQARIAEMGQELAFEGQVHNVNIAASEARLAGAKAEHALETIGINKGANAIRAQIEGLQVGALGLQASENIRLMNMSKIDLLTLQKASMGPAPASGKIAIGGFEYTPTEIRERQKALEVRDQMSFLSPQATDPDYAAKMRVANMLQVQTMTIPELEQLRKDGFQMPNGTQVDAADWESEWARQNRLQQEGLQTRLNEQMIENQVPIMIRDSQKLLDDTSELAVPSSQLGVARAQYTAALGAVAQVAAADATPMGKIQQVTLLEKARMTYVKQIEETAIQKAAGDKELGNLYFKQMTKQQVTPEEVSDVLRTRYIQQKSFGQVLPADVSSRLRRTADTIIADKQKQQAQNQLNPMSTEAKLNDKEIREQAFNEAFQKEQNEVGSEGINVIQKHLMQRTDNPAIKAGLVPAAMESMAAQAQNMALQKAKESYGLTDAQILGLKMSDPVAAGLAPNKAAEVAYMVNQMSVGFEYDLLEKHRPGLGYEVKQWTGQVMPEVIDSYMNTLDPMKKAMAGDSVVREAQSLTDLYNSADESASRRGEALITELATGAKKPENSWIVMLNMNKSLADSQKQALYYQVITPAIEQARNQGMNDEQTSAAIFNALNTYKSDDPTLLAALRTTQRQLPDIVDNFEQMWAATIMMGMDSRIQAQRATKDPQLANDRLKSVVPWLK